MCRIVLAAVMCVFWTSTFAASGEESQERSVRVPSTISKEAQEFLSQEPPIPTKSPQTLDDWQQRRATMEAVGKSLYEEGRHKYKVEHQSYNLRAAMVIKCRFTK